MEGAALLFAAHVHAMIASERSELPFFFLQRPYPTSVGLPMAAGGGGSSRHGARGGWGGRLTGGCGCERRHGGQGGFGGRLPMLGDCPCQPGVAAVVPRHHHALLAASALELTCSIGNSFSSFRVYFFRGRHFVAAALKWDSQSAPKC